MKRLMIGLFASLFLASPAFAGSIVFDFGNPQTLTTTGGQEAALTRVLTAINAERTASGQAPFATRELWLRSILVDAVQSYLQQAKKNNRDDACTAYNAASGAVQSAIDAQLGGKSPCQ